MIKNLFDRVPLLSTRLSAYIFCAAAIPLLLFSVIAYRLYAKEHYENQLEHLEFVRDDRIHRISTWFEERRRDLVYFSGQIEASARKNGGKIDMTSSAAVAFMAYGRAHADVEGVLLLNSKGDVLLCSRDFRDSDGNTVTNIMETPVFGEMIRHGRDDLHVSGWFKSSVDGVLRMYVSRCVHQGPEVAVVLAVQVNINKWVEFLENRKGLSEEEDVLIYSGEGQNQNPMYWLEGDGRDPERSVPVFDASTLRKRSDGRALDAIDYRGVSVVAVQAPVPFTDFTLAAKCDSAKVYRHLRWAFWGGSLVVFVLITLSAFGAKLLAHRITEPFRILSRTAVEISMGNLGARARLNRSDEIGRLANAFDTATEKMQVQVGELERLRCELKQERDELDRKVQERTEELRRANSISRAIADYTVDWELWLSPIGQLRWTNPACEKVTGYSIEEMLNTPDFWRLISEGSTRKMFLSLFRAALDGLNGEKVEFRCRKKDGSLIWLRTSWQRIYDSDGTYIGMRASAHDVTAEVDQRQENQRLAEVVNQSSSAIIIRDGNGTAIYANGASSRMFGIAPDEIVGKSRSDFFARYTKESSGKIVEEIESCIQEGRRWEGAVENRREGGDCIVTQTLVFPVHNEDGSIANYVESRTDITAEIENKNRLRQMATAVEQCVDGIVIRDLVSGKAVYVNDSFLAITGYGRDYVLQSMVPGTGPNTLTNCNPKCVEALLAKKTWREICDQPRADGTTFKMDCTLSPICDETGNVVYGLGFFRDVTQDAAVREELTVLQNAIRQVNEGVMIVDMDLRIVYVNDVYSKMTLRSREDILGETIYDLYAGQGLDDAISESFRIVSDGASWHNIYPAFRKDGSSYTEEVLASPVRNADGKIVHCVVSYRDVTAETETREELRRMSTAVEQSVIAILIRDLNGRAIYANLTYLELFGITWDDCRGKKSEEDFPRSPESLAMRKEAMVFLSENKTWRGVYPELRKDGSRLWISNTTSRILDSEGKAVYQLSYLMDVTQELSVRERADSLAKIVEQSKTGIVVVGRDLKVLYANEALLGIYHAERSDIEGCSVLDFVQLSSGRSVFSRALKTVLTGKSWESRFLNVRLDGEPFHQDVIVSPVTDADGKVVQIAIYCRDVTEEVKARDEVERLGIVLNQSVTAMMITDPSAQVEFANDSFFILTGFKRDEVVGRNIRDLPFGDEFEKEFVYALEVLQEGRPWMGYFTSSRDGGEAITVNVFVSPVKDGAGKPSSYLLNFWDVTEEIKNRTEVSRLAQVLEQSVNAIEIKTLDLKILYVNRAYTEMTGLAKSDVVGKGAQDIGLDCILPETYEEIRRTVLAGKTWTGRVHSCRKGGTPYLVKMVVSPVFDAQGAVMNLVVNKQDITQEAAAVETAERLGGVLQQSSLAMAVSDADRRLTDVNEAFLKMHGGRREDMLGRFVADLPISESLLEFSRKSFSALEKGETFSDEYVISDGAGGERVCEGVVSTVFGKDGRILYHLAIFRDITHEVETRNRMVQLAQAIEQSPYAVEILDKDGKIVYVNAAHCQFSGYASDEVVEKNFAKLNATALDPENSEKMWDAIRTGNVWHGDIATERKDGTRYVMRLVMAPIKNGKGEIINFVSTGMDITPMVELEAQMRQAQKMDSVGRLAGGIAHDFNNMLQGIMGFAELLDLDTEGNSALNPNVKEIQRAAARARDLTRQLLAFGRKQQSRPQSLDLNEQIVNMEKMLARLLGANAPLVIELDEGLSKVMADPGQVEQAIMNLVLNARDAVAQANYARIAITTEDCFVSPEACVGNLEMRPGHYARVSISDNGCGVSAELGARIFEPFFTTKENEKGTGLGLSVVYGIMKQHQGWIGLESVIGKGATFSLYFPVDEGTVKSIAVAVEKPIGPSDLAGRGETILVVEDEDLVRDLAVQNLKRAGYEVLTAPTAPHGLKMFMQNKKRIKLLFSDIVLLDGTGVELADHIRKMAPGLPVLLTSGFSREHLENRDLDADNYGFLPKPYVREDMLKAISAALKTPMTVSEKPSSDSAKS